MSNHFILVIDAGTGAGRASLFDLEGNIRCSAYHEWAYIKLPEKASGAVEFDVDVFWQDIVDLIREVIATSGVDPVEIAAVTATSQRHGMVFIDRDGREIYAAPNLDLRGENVIPDLEKWKNEIFRITGLPLHGMFGLTRLKWFSKFDKPLYDRIDRIMMLSDWICYRLSGVCASEPSIACSSQLFDVERLDFSEQLMDQVGLRKDIFPPVVQAGKPVGSITKEISNATGLSAGIPVTNGGGDTLAGVLGMGLYLPGQLAVVAGTTTPLIFLSESPLKYQDTGVYTDCHVYPGIWGVETNAGSTGFSFRWAKRLFMKEARFTEDPYTLMEKAASEVPIGANGMLAYIGIELAGHDPGQNLGGFIFPVPWDIEDVSVKQFYRAAMETNIYAVRANMDQLAAMTNIQPQVLHLCGGQSKSPLFTQGLADLTGLPVNVYKVQEATSLGACLSTACGIDLFKDMDSAIHSMVHFDHTYEPDPEGSRQYQKVYDRWLKFYEEVLSSYRM